MDVNTLVKDKEFLRAIVKNNDRSVDSEVNTYILAKALMTNLGSSDAELRDELSYSILGHTIHGGLLTASQLDELLDMCLTDNYLFAGIGEEDTDSVFVRSFSALIVAAIVGADAKHTQLPPERIHQTTRNMVDYAHRERDRRGYVDGKGWVHTVAHTADALDACAQHPVSTADERQTILAAVFDLATIPVPVTFLEDDRLAFVVLRMVQGGKIDLAFMHDWIGRFHIEITAAKDTVLRHVNAVHFLRSLYFLLHWTDPNHSLLPVISEQQRVINIYHRDGLV